MDFLFMNFRTLGNSNILNLIFKPAGAVMESRLRNWCPMKTLRGADIQPGQTVLEVVAVQDYSLYRQHNLLVIKVV
jgi:hypothetical protein